MGLLIIVFSLSEISYYKTVSISFLCIGLLTDIFDGILARKLKVSSQKLRRLDSSIDQVFFLSFTLATFFQSPDFFITHATSLILLFFVEGLAYLICFIKFKREIATHTIGAKIWTLILFMTFIDLILNGNSNTLYYICFGFGVITRIEIIAVLLILKKWTTDIPTFYHAIKLRQGKKIKRNSLLNG